ncbi:MAG: non-homologous end-joining DNA ligase [Wenzhouxiangellaceae bacterium]|nr:non-homologous end-joining DNA ligase [Wenzhouxiangellaceae bacterium]
MNRTIEVGNRKLEIGHPDKVFFPESGLTKFDLVEYYARVAEHALPHCRERALSMHRYPDGIDGTDFFQKSIPDHFPDWIDRVTLPKRDGEVTYVVANDAATLAYLADQGCITPHLALARVDSPRKPDRLIFDLDPSDDDFGKVRDAARRIRDLLEDMGVTGYVQTTGSRGLHVFVPLRAEDGFDGVREFSHAMRDRLVDRHPDLLTAEQRKEKRGNRVFVDDLRNAYGQTAVAPYAVRARPGAPVATPLRWDELDDGDLHPRRYTIRNLFRRLGQVDDPWQDMQRHACTLHGLRRRLERAGRS